jgi:hypothetical protein
VIVVTFISAVLGDNTAVAKPNRERTRVMPINAIRLERLAYLLILVAVGIVFQLVVLIRAFHATSKELAAMGPRRLVAAWGGLSRPHSPPAA